MNFRKKSLTLSVFSFVTIVFSQEKPKVDLGGALRFNYNFSSWKNGQKKRGGDFGFDLFRINTKAKYKGVKLNAEYRFYSQSFGGGMLKQGWIGYDFNERDNLQIGLTQVPFGITQYDSHSWFFGINYYLGLEDDHDMGVKFTHKGSKWDYAFAFFKNAEELNFGNNSDLSSSRYSYDVASIDINNDGVLDIRYKEINQLNGKVNYHFKNKSAQNKIGASVEYGGLYNLATEEVSSHYALALHYELNLKRLNTKAQIATYKYNTKNSTYPNLIALAAYGAPYLTATEATTYTLGVAYTFPVKWNPISSIQIYNDFGYMDKTIQNFEDSYMNVLGFLATAGNVYTYVDFAAGKNHPWLGPVWTNALASGTPNANWEMRFNINIGYYF